MELLFSIRKYEHGEDIAQGVGDLLFFQKLQQSWGGSPILQESIKVFICPVGVSGASGGEAFM